MKTRTYRPRSVRVTFRLKRASMKRIAALAFANEITFDQQVMALVMGELG